ncbi:MAG: hypothetical protein HW421_3513 [Ignavibacteria bacterium]|nr:hypothetical protein [Ignavibacteria bacterium]
MNRLLIVISLVIIGNFHIGFAGRKITIEMPKDTSLSAYTHGFGAFLHYNYNIHSADFKKLPGVPSCCPKYESGYGSSESGGFIYEINDSSKWSAQVRLGYYSESAHLESIESLFISDANSGQSILGRIRHSIDSRISTLSLIPTVSYSIYNNFQAHLGISAGYLFEKKFSQKETIIEPEGAVYKNTGESTQLNISGTIDKTNTFQAGIVGGLSYSLPLSKKGKLLLVPEIYYTLGLTSLIETDPWRTNGLRVGLSLKYVFKKEPPRPIKTILNDTMIVNTITLPAPEDWFLDQDTIHAGIAAETNKREYNDEINDTIVTTIFRDSSRIDTLYKAPKEPQFEVDISAVPLDSSNSEQFNQPFKIEEFISKRSFPLLTQVFFDENSFVIPTRYTLLELYQTVKFSESMFNNKSVMEVYYNMLNVLASRLKKIDSAKITITGFSGLDSEKDNTELARKRAEAVRNYLRDVWFIDSTRMKIFAEKTPLRDIREDRERKNQELRCVKITSDNSWKIVEPVFTTDTIRKNKFNSIRFKPKVFAEAGVLRWAIRVRQGNRELKEIKGIGEIPKLVDWKIDSGSTKGIASVIQDTTPINYYLTVTNKPGKTKGSEDSTLKVDFTSKKQKEQEKQQDKDSLTFSLILFDFDKADISADNRRIIETIKFAIAKNSKVKIIGYSDSIGTEDHLKRLAKRRAEAVAKELNLSPEQLISVDGVGASDKFPNSLPEGRLYCRTVDVIIETMIEAGKK